MTAPDVVHRYLAGLSCADVDAVLACVADDFVNEHTSALGSSCRGRDEYARRLPGFLGQFDRLRYDVVDSIAEFSDDAPDDAPDGMAARVAVRYRMTADHAGHPIDIPGVMLFVVGGGLIEQRTDVWDSLTFLRQTGAA